MTSSKYAMLGFIALLAIALLAPIIARVAGMLVPLGGLLQ